jgi:hypothetical protein
MNRKRSSANLRPLLLLALALLTNGCMTHYCVEHAKARAGQKVTLNSDTDQIIRNDGTNCVLQRTAPNGATNRMSLHMVTSDTGYVRKPLRFAYYALVPFTIPADFIAFPFEAMFGYIFPPIG